MEEKEVIKMYKAFIQPYFLYGIEVWGHSVKSEKDILLSIQDLINSIQDLYTVCPRAQFSAKSQYFSSTSLFSI